jgi:hypothetical protein
MAIPPGFFVHPQTQGTALLVVIAPYDKKSLLLSSIQDKMEDVDSEWLTINPKTDKPFGSVKTLLRLACKRPGI